MNPQQPKVPHEPVVDIELNNLIHAQDTLSETLSMLDNRLTPVMYNKSKPDEVLAEAPDPPMCLLAKRIYTIRCITIQQNKLVNKIIDQLEI